jgi:hypothetical protein
LLAISGGTHKKIFGKMIFFCNVCAPKWDEVEINSKTDEEYVKDYSIGKLMGLPESQKDYKRLMIVDKDGEPIGYKKIDIKK